MESTGDEDLFYSGLKTAKYMHGVFKFFRAKDDDVPFRTIEFWDTFVSEIREEMAQDGKPMFLHLVLSPATVRFNKSIVFQKNWFVTDIDKKPEKTKDNKEEKTLVQAVTGEKEALPNQKIEYRVTRYNKSDASDADRKNVRWAVKIDGKQKELKDKKGEKITLEIEPEWAGKEIIVMACLDGFKEDVSQKTMVQQYLIICTNSGKELFYLDGRKKNYFGKKTAKEAYKLAIQWFEPTADDYLPLLRINENIKTYNELKHFSWNKIAEFAEQDRWMLSYQPKHSGDWKYVKEGADGYLLVTVGGVPYWADAIGQIPFAVDCFTDYLSSTKSYMEAKQKTIKKAKEYGDGKIFGGTSDYRNSYDNAMIIRAINWASKRYILKDDKLLKTSYSPQELSKASNGVIIK